MARHSAPHQETTQLLFELLRAVGLRAQTQLNEKSIVLEDPVMSVQADNSLNAVELQCLTVNSEKTSSARCIRLPSFSKDGTQWVPLLWLDRRPNEVAFQLVVAGSKRRFGYRWEPPEDGSGERGRHAYYHAQPITSIRRPGGGSIQLKLGHNHICDDFPAFPIDAGGGLDLLDAMFVSLYGPGYTLEFILEAQLRNAVHDSTCNRGWAKARTSATSQASQTRRAATRATKKKSRR